MRRLRLIARHVANGGTFVPTSPTLCPSLTVCPTAASGREALGVVPATGKGVEGIVLVELRGDQCTPEEIAETSAITTEAYAEPDTPLIKAIEFSYTTTERAPVGADREALLEWFEHTYLPQEIRLSPYIILAKRGCDPVTGINGQVVGTMRLMNDVRHGKVRFGEAGRTAIIPEFRAVAGLHAQMVDLQKERGRRWGFDFFYCWAHMPHVRRLQATGVLVSAARNSAGSMGGAVAFLVPGGHWDDSACREVLRQQFSKEGRRFLDKISRAELQEIKDGTTPKQFEDVCAMLRRVGWLSDEA